MFLRLSAFMFMQCIYYAATLNALAVALVLDNDALFEGVKACNRALRV
jgi:hypothetical protein